MPRLGKLSLNFYHRELAGRACRRVQKSDNVRVLIRQMLRLMQQHDGTGLSAPQVGVFLQLAVVKLPPSNEIQVLINPEIVNWAGKDFLATESCLSLPPTERAKARIWRSEIVHVRNGTLEEPDAENLTIYRGAAARIVQHEIDHLDGVFFIDRCQPVGKAHVLRAYESFLLGQGELVHG
jgi:peptide deformylase